MNIDFIYVLKDIVGSIGECNVKDIVGSIC